MDTDPPPPAKALRFTLELDGHDRRDLADSLRQLAYDIEAEDTTGSVSSRGWVWNLEVRSALTPDEYHAALAAWADARRRPLVPSPMEMPSATAAALVETLPPVGHDG